jgi:hypothetical protein
MKFRRLIDLAINLLIRHAMRSMNEREAIQVEAELDEAVRWLTEMKTTIPALRARRDAMRPPLRGEPGEGVANFRRVAPFTVFDRRRWPSLF